VLEQVVETSPARQAWSALEPAWQEAIGMAWDSYRAGGVGVGAVITDDSGAVVGRGRNQRFDSRAPQGLLAHAEMAALATVPDDKGRARHFRLYTTLHPCPMCLGAMVIARIGHLHFGAYDPTWLGIEQLPRLNDEVRNRWPSVEGPLPGPVGEWLAVLPALNTNGTLVGALRQATPRRADLAVAVAETLNRGEMPRSPELALEKVWDCLTPA
jgi:tRNA(Arg) A34 adenosine deaminase TadA